MNKIGWIGGILLALCAVPQAWECYTTQSAAGLSWGFLGMWGAGEVCLLIATLPLRQWFLTANYVLNLLALAVIYWYKLAPLF
jgi:uncharacterized protein with PQ loop repeat